MLFFVLWYVDVCLSKRYWSGFFLRRGEGDHLLDASCDSSQEKGGIADVSEPDRVVVVIGDDFWTLFGEFIVSFHVVPYSKSCAQSFVLNHMLWSKVRRASCNSFSGFQHFWKCFSFNNRPFGCVV